MADTSYGLGPQGFTPMQLPEIQSDIQAQVQLRFGNVDLSDQSVFGQLIGIISASAAQVWQAGAAIYASSYPEGATGIAVDNLLALNNLSRLPEQATVTNPTPATRSDGVILYGLRLLGTPGTVVPAGTLISNGAATPATFSLDASVIISGANNARQVLYFGGVPTSGTYALRLTDGSGNSLTTSAIPYSAQAATTVLTWPTNPTGSYTLTLGGTNTTSSLSATATATQVQAAINAISGFAQVSVTGSVASGMQIAWGNGYAPMLTCAGAGAPTGIAHAVAAYVHALATSAGVQPFTDVLVSPGAQSLTFSFGAFAPQSSQPSTAAQPVSRIAAPAPSLYNGSQQISLTPQIAVVGNAAQGFGTATCTDTGPTTVLAGQLTNIATPVSGLSGVTNDLDCLTGRDVESDADAIARFKAQLGSSSSGSLGALTKRVGEIEGVTQVVGFQNTGNAAGQVLLFAGTPSSGSFSLLIGGQSTALLPYNATAGAVQAAIRGLTGFGGVIVTTYGQSGYQIDFAGVRGNQALPLVTVPQNTTQVALTAYYGRPPHSVELVVEGGADSNVAQAILAALPAGIATFSNPSLRTTATLTAGQSQISLQSTAGLVVGQTVEASGVPLGSTVNSISGNTATLSAAATASGSQVPIAFTYSPLLKDSAGNVLSIGFSRPQSVLIFVSLTLVTDIYISPGDSTSGLNSASQWSPAYAAGIQQSILDLINAVQIGGTISARGTNGLGGSFRTVPGIVDYTLAFGTTPSPTNTNDLSLQSNQAPTAQSYSVQVSFT